MNNVENAQLMPMRLSDFILKNRETILRDWEAFATTLIPASQLQDPIMLRDHAIQILDTIAADLARPQSKDEQSEKSKGRRPIGETAATAHGVQRLGAGFSIVSTVAEYRALRASVTRLWQEEHIAKTLSRNTHADLIRFNEAIDQAVSESITSFSAEKDRQTRVFGTILSSSPDLSFTFDLDGRFAYVNKAVAELFGVSAEIIVGKDYFDLEVPAAAELQGQIADVISTKKQLRGDTSYVTSSGQESFYEYIFAPVLTTSGEVEAVAGTARNITERKASEDSNWRKANYDLLTGLANRRMFRDRLDHAVKHAGRTEAPIALLFIDLDYFKEVNDSLGHEAGDLLLQLVAERLRSCVRETDTLARLGGDEFTVILQDFTGVEHVELVAGKILQELASPFQLNNQTVDLSASMGVSLWPKDASTLEDLIKKADRAMFAAKGAGRNQFSFFSPEQEQSVEARLRLIADLRSALAQHQFDLVYQAIVDIRSGRITKAEALLRWDHPEYGLMLPGQFIEPAEKAGLMHEIGSWVFTEVALRSRQWSDLLKMPFQISINMSALQFRAAPKTVNWGGYLKDLGLPPRSIAVDIKEEVILDGAAEVRKRIMELHDAGIALSIDDFGTGPSSIAYLKKFAVDTIKLDPSVVHAITTDVSSQMTTTASITMAHSLGLKVIAEGVETNEQLEWLKAAGCDYGQGYLFAAPLSSKEFEKLIQTPVSFVK